MLEIVKFQNGKYGLRNSLTGIILCKNDHIREFKSPEKAYQAILKINHKLIRTLARLQKDS